MTFMSLYIEDTVIKKTTEAPLYLHRKARDRLRILAVGNLHGH